MSLWRLHSAQGCAPEPAYAGFKINNIVHVNELRGTRMNKFAFMSAALVLAAQVQVAQAESVNPSMHNQNGISAGVYNWGNADHYVAAAVTLGNNWVLRGEYMDAFDSTYRSQLEYHPDNPYYFFGGASSYDFGSVQIGQQEYSLGSESGARFGGGMRMGSPTNPITLHTSLAHDTAANGWWSAALGFEYEFMSNLHVDFRYQWNSDNIENETRLGLKFTF